MTGRGLVDTLQGSPTSVHVLEDAESMFGDRRAWGILRSALWSQSRKRPPERKITWTAHGVQIDFIFIGGIIIIANSDLQHVPELAALQTRIPVLQLTASFAEIAALMRDVTSNGYRYDPDYLNPVECQKVVEWIIERMRSENRSLDMRLMRHGLHDYILWRAGQSKTHWEDLMEAHIRRQTIPYKTRAERTTEEATVAREIMAMDVPTKDVGSSQEESHFRSET